jgi:hypothetical protein
MSIKTKKETHDPCQHCGTHMVEVLGSPCGKKLLCEDCHLDALHEWCNKHKEIKEDKA